MKKEYIEFDGVIVDIEIAQEKAKHVCECLEQRYFCLSDKQAITYCHNSAKVENDIVLDYLYQIENKLNELRSMMEG